MGLIKSIKGIFSNQPEAETKATPSQRRGNTANKVIQSATKQECVGNPDTHSAGKTDNQGQKDGVFPTNPIKVSSGFHDAWNGNEAWDKHRKTDAVKLYEQALAKGYGGDAGYEPWVHLGMYYREAKDWKNLKRILKVSPEFMRKQRWHVEGVRLVEANLGKMPNGWIDIGIGKTANENGGETWLKKYERLTETLPVFDFDVADNESKIRGEDVTALREFDLSLKRRLNEARDCEAKNDYRQAAEIYAEFVRNGYWKTEPYTRLMEIYRMAGLDDECRRLMKHAIDHFSQQRFWMRDRVIRLSYFHDCNAFVEKTINEGKRILYYDGLFDVYSPYPEIEEWQKQLGD